MPEASSSSYPSLIPLGPHGDKPAIPLNRPVILVGSHEGARLHLVSRSVSRAHCLLVVEDSGTYVRDLQSRTHTIINGREVHEAVLKTGDVLEIGTFKFRFNDVSIKADPLSPPPGQLVLARLPEPILIRSRVILIGRRPGSDLTLDEDAVSTAHAVLYEKNGERFVRDLGSRTGTRVNGKAIHDSPLALGDSIRIGDTLIRYDQADVSPDILAGMSSAVADDLEHLVGTAPLVDEPQAPTPINEVSVKPAPPVEEPLPLPLAFEPELDLTPGEEPPTFTHGPVAPEPAVSEAIPVEPEIDLSSDPDIVGSNDTLELPPIQEEEPKKPVLSDQVLDLTDNTDIAVEPKGLSDLGAIAGQISSVGAIPVEPELAAEDVTPREVEPVESQPPVKPKKGRGWRGRQSKKAKSTEPPVAPAPEPQPQSDQPPAAKTDVAIEETATDSVFRIPNDPDNDTAVLEHEPITPKKNGVPGKVNVQLAENLSEWRKQAARDLENIDFSKLDLSQREDVAEEIAPLDLASEPQTAEATQEEARLDLDVTEEPNQPEQRFESPLIGPGAIEEPAEPEQAALDEASEVVDATTPEPQSAQSLDAEIEAGDAPAPATESVRESISDTTFGREVENLSGADVGVPVIDEAPEVQDDSITSTPTARTPLQAIADMAQNFDREEIESEPEPAAESYRMVEEDRPMKSVASESEDSMPTIEEIIEDQAAGHAGIDPHDVEDLPAETATESIDEEPQLALEEPPVEKLPDVEAMTAEPIDFLNISEPEQTDPLLHTESVEAIENESPVEAPLKFDLTDAPCEPLMATTDESAVVPESEVEVRIDESTELPVDESSELPEIEGAATISPLPEPPVEVEQVLPPAPEGPIEVEEVVQTAPAPEETVESPPPAPAVSSAGIDSPMVAPSSAGVFEVPTRGAAPKAEQAATPAPQAAPPSPTKSLFDELFGDAPEASSFLGGMPLQLPDAPSSFGRVNIGFDARPIGAPGGGTRSAPPQQPGARTFTLPNAKITMPPMPARPSAIAPAIVTEPEPVEPEQPTVTPVSVTRVSPPEVPDPAQRRGENITDDLDAIDDLIKDEPLRPSSSASAVEAGTDDRQTGSRKTSGRDELQGAFDGLAISQPMRTPPRPVFSGNRVRERDLSNAGEAQPKKKKKKAGKKVPRDPFTLSPVPTDVPVQVAEQAEPALAPEPQARVPRAPLRSETSAQQRLSYAAAPESPPMAVAPGRRGPSLVKVALSMLIAMICVPVAIYSLVPVEHDIEARMVFKNLENVNNLMEMNRIRVEQRQLIDSPGVRADAERRLKSRAESLGGTVGAGFLADPIKFSRITSKMDWPEDRRNALVIPYKSTDQKGDTLRFQALIDALYTANQPKIDANNSKRSEVKSMEAAVGEQQRKVESLQAKIAELRQIGDNRPAQATLTALEAEAARLEKAWIEAITARKELSAEVERLKRPLPETVDTNAKDTKAEDLKNQLEQARADLASAQAAQEKALEEIAGARAAYNALSGGFKDNDDLAAYAAMADKLLDLDAAGRTEQLDKLAADYAVKIDARLVQLKADDSELKAMAAAKDAAEKKYKDALGSGDEESIKSAKAEFDEAFQKHTHREQALSDSLAEARAVPKKVADALAALDRARQAETAATAQVAAATKLQAELTTKLEGRDKEFAAELAASARQRNLDREKQLEIRAGSLGNAEKVEKEAEAFFFTKKKEVIAARAAVENERKSHDQLIQQQEEEVKARDELKEMSKQLEQKQAELAKTVEPIEPTSDNVRIGEKRDMRPTYSLVSVLLIAVVSLSVMYASHRMGSVPAMAQPVPPALPNHAARTDQMPKPNASEDDDATDLIPGK